MCETRDLAMPVDGIVASLIWKRLASPPDCSDIVPRAHLERFLAHPVTGIGATAAVASMAEIRLPVLPVEVNVHDVQRRLCRVILADPEVPIRLDVEEK